MYLFFKIRYEKVVFEMKNMWDFVYRDIYI